ncbi:hypothetical protein [Cytobacillus gottheilii]|uniref:DUF2207 domain-containing protein n=1 Tax=Cytobacillus gottheilii TaxID=859144 RepID=A0ABX8F8P4_9BACI|nr:hypothetical protein [Cytobacillus gottheilii]QVY59846.1 hypothetical protein J1899_12335 [Cytobacillus gottheilii]
MEFFIVIFIMIFLAVILTATNRPKKRIGTLKKTPVPDDLGLQITAAMPIEEKLEQSLPFSYEDNVLNRVLREFPKTSSLQVDWAIYELKRYFVMNAILKSVPMFSAKADEVWHEMLMFTREYQQFCNSFFGGYLHHAPNLNTAPIPGERAFFDWVYLSLFNVEENSKIIWGAFLKHPMKKEILSDFRNKDEEALLEKYFNTGKEYMDVKMYLIHKMKDEMNEANRLMNNGDLLTLEKGTDKSQVYMYASSAIIFYSLYEPDLFEDHMHEYMPKEMTKDHYAGGGSSCSGFGCSSSSDSDSGGGSSCSSCGGGGCSS